MIQDVGNLICGERSVLPFSPVALPLIHFHVNCIFLCLSPAPFLLSLNILLQVISSRSLVLNSICMQHFKLISSIPCAPQNSQWPTWQVVGVSQNLQNYQILFSPVPTSNLFHIPLPVSPLWHYCLFDHAKHLGFILFSSFSFWPLAQSSPNPCIPDPFCHLPFTPQHSYYWARQPDFAIKPAAPAAATDFMFFNWK